MSVSFTFSVFCNHKCICALPTILAAFIKIISVAGKKSERRIKLEWISAELSKYIPYTNPFYKHFRHCVFIRPEKNPDFSHTTFQIFNISKTDRIKSVLIYPKKISRTADKICVISPPHSNLSQPEFSCLKSLILLEIPLQLFRKSVKILRGSLIFQG